jgi:hypothetical protein
VICSTNTFGSPDLDTRPSEMQRSTIFAWVERCPHCGYCASDVSESHPEASSVVEGEEYQDQLNDPACPELANSFLCEAIIEREAGNYAAATWALIHAAWVCDDSDLPIQATVCRHKATDMFVRAEGHGQPLTDQAGVSTAILVDLLRRSGRLIGARRVATSRREGISEDIILRILDFQAALVEKGDVACHTIAEAIGEE